MSEFAETLRELFDAVVALPAGARAAFIDERCAGDAKLRRELELLLTHDSARPADYLDSARVDLDGAEMRPELGVGDTIDGRYKLLEKLGEGGVGIVYRAEQFKPVTREVALKVIKPGMDTKGVLRRFDAERQALALMDHPGIAGVLDGGMTDAGRPYFVMELVRGVPITAYCDEYNLPTKQRLRLFAEVCRAVEHAHQKGIIHRDLKPSNVLITVRDEKPVPKIIDFGIAKAISGRLTEGTLYTHIHELVGTPAYMSPEQTRNEIDVDTRADVYSLGVLLYQLLTGATPFGAATLSGKSYEEICRIVREVEPAKPSSRIVRTRDEDQETPVDEVARRRQVNPATLRRFLRGDLDWIVMKALEKDRTRRYETASALAEDVGRHLRNEPVLAGPPSTVYRIRKFAGRNKGVLGAVAGFAVLLVGFSIAMYFESEENRRRALSESEAKNAAVLAFNDAERERRRADATATDLARSLRRVNIERGRLLSLTGSLLDAEALLWPEFLRDPDAPDSYWALWELYSRIPVLATLAASERDVVSIEVSPDGSFYVTGAEDGRITIWDAETHRAIGVLEGHEREVSALTFDPDSTMLVSAGADGRVIVWDVRGRRALRELGPSPGAVRRAFFGPNGDFVVATGQSPEVSVWEVTTGERVAVLDVVPGASRCVQFTPDGDAIVVGTSTGRVLLWKWHSPSVETVTLGNHDGSVDVLRLAPDGGLVAAGGGAREIHLWDVAAREYAGTIPAWNGPIRGLHFSGDSRLLTVCGYWRVDTWDVESRRRVRSQAMRVVPKAMARDDVRDVVLTSMPPGVLTIMNDDPHAGVVRLDGHTGRTAATFSADGRFVATGDAVGVVRLWDAATGGLLRTLEGHRGQARSLRFNPDGSTLATVATGERTARLWNLETGETTTSFRVGQTSTVQGIDFDPSGTVVASVGTSRVTLRDARTGVEIGGFDASDGTSVLSVRYSPDGKMIATTSRTGSRNPPGVRLWTAAGEPIETLEPGNSAWTLAFSHDGRRIASGNWQSTIVVWDTATREVVQTLEGHSAAVYGVAFSPSNPDLLASNSEDGTVRLWDVPSGRTLATFKAFDGYGITIAFGRDEYGVERLVASSGEGKVLIWDLSFFDQHIAGNIDYQVGRWRDELGDEIRTEKLLAWKNEVLGRPRQRPRPAREAPVVP